MLPLEAAQQGGTVFSLLCDEGYRRDMSDILTQFSGFTNRATLDAYRNYMILVKEQVDLGYIFRPLENSFTSYERTRLRTPLQHYVDCRPLFRGLSGLNLLEPTSKFLSPCERTYAVEVQDALKFYSRIVNPVTLQDYQDFMILVKRYQDLSFRLGYFEKLVSSDVFSKLRLPMRRYNNCKDAFIRAFTPAGYGVASPVP